MDIKKQLKSAAIDSIAAEDTGTSTFEKMLGVAFIAPSAFSVQIKETEEAIKKEYSLSKMPSPWRSAKSVCSQCLNLGISLIDENGNYLGKTALQNKIKKHKGVKPPVDVKDAIKDLLHTLPVGEQILILRDLLVARGIPC